MDFLPASPAATQPRKPCRMQRGKMEPCVFPCMELSHKSWYFTIMHSRGGCAADLAWSTCLEACGTRAFRVGMRTATLWQLRKPPFAPETRSKFFGRFRVDPSSDFLCTSPGGFSAVLSPTSFYPMLAGIPSVAQAARARAGHGVRWCARAHAAGRVAHVRPRPATLPCAEWSSA